MFGKVLKYGIWIIIILFLGYHSVYFKKLEGKSIATGKFDAKKYAQTFWKKKLTPELSKAIELNNLVSLLRTNPNETFDKRSHALGIGNIRFFLVRGEGEITSVSENDITVLVKSDTAQMPAKLITEYVFGNAVRDASGLLNINEFANMNDFNSISEELNNIVRIKDLPPFKSNAKKGMKVQWVGAIELNREHLNLDDIEVIPIETKIQ
jgi:predicted lipoprotein